VCRGRGVSLRGVVLVVKMDEQDEMQMEDSGSGSRCVPRVLEIGD